MAKSNPQILDFYRELSEAPGWAIYENMRMFLETLFELRELDECVLFNSHQILRISRQLKYPEWFDGPLLSLDLTPGGGMRFELAITVETVPVVRRTTESVNCPMGVALHEFDIMYAKWEAAHDGDH